MLSQSENFEIEFKQSANNLKGEYFAAFANSKYGGTIFIGVKEITDENGKQKGEIIGCKVGDQEKVSLNNKAQQCFPPVDIEIFTENVSKKPFFRVEIKSGKNKPYCSSGGTYKIRRDGNIESLYPSDLLNFFIKEESGKFLQKFKEATVDLRNELYNQNIGLIENIVNTSFKVKDSVDDLLDEFSSKLKDVSQEIQNTEEQVISNLESLKEQNEFSKEYSENIQEEIRQETDIGNRNIIHLAWKINAILNHLGIEDPEITREKDFIKSIIEMEKAALLVEKKKITKRTKKSLFNKCKKDFNQKMSSIKFEEFEKWCDEIEPNDFFVKSLMKRK